IKHVFRYRDKQDFITEIEAGDGDNDFRNAIMNETLAAGTNNAQLADRAATSLSGGTTKGVMNTSSQTRRRGKVISAPTRKVLSDLARESGADWSIQDGQLMFVPTKALLPGEAIKINAETGMLKAPEITESGVTVETLMEPMLRVYGAIHINNNDIKEQSKEQKEGTGTPRLSPDGIYKVVEVKHTGDTHTKDWYSEIKCVAL
ncbi:MAG: hypothetical protein LBI31_03620, partial [Zoogloeaceae bacterium]|nr:hypothetical protein [Zoogloeaceae bacterium]